MVSLGASRLSLVDGVDYEENCTAAQQASCGCGGEAAVEDFLGLPPYTAACLHVDCRTRPPIQVAHRAFDVPAGTGSLHPV